MEKSNFKVRYVRLNKPCQVRVGSESQVKGFFLVTEVYFKEHKDTIDTFYIIEGGQKTYIKTVNVNKIVYGDTVQIHINTLKSGYYKINIHDIDQTDMGFIIRHKIEALLEDIYGNE